MKFIIAVTLLLLSTTLLSQTRENRTLTIPLNGTWSITYNPNTNVPKKSLFGNSNKADLRSVSLAKIDTITIQSIQIKCETNKYFNQAYDEILVATNKFFSGSRTITFSSRADMNDALIYAAWFLDLISYTQYGGVDFDVLRIDGKDKSGRTLYVDGDRLMKYKPKK